MCKNSGKKFFFFFFFSPQIGEIKKLVNLFPKKQRNESNLH